MHQAPPGGAERRGARPRTFNNRPQPRWSCWQSLLPLRRDGNVVFMGVSAGSVCWFVGGTTDSFGLPLHPVTDGLGFLPYSNSPHHDAEEQRRPVDGARTWQMTRRGDGTVEEVPLPTRLLCPRL
jgi:hypothetical protein